MGIRGEAFVFEQHCMNMSCGLVLIQLDRHIANLVSTFYIELSHEIVTAKLQMLNDSCWVKTGPSAQLNALEHSDENYIRISHTNIK